MWLLLLAAGALSPTHVVTGVKATTHVVTGVRAIADRYDAVLLDQFGVLHDGKRALPGAVHCYDQLAAAGKRLIVLSNTSRRRAFAMSKLPGLGFDADALTGFVCSGEQAWQHMVAHRRGQKCVWLSWSEDFHAWQADYLEGTGVRLASAGEADFILCHGSQVVRTVADSAGVPTGLETGDELNAAADEILAECAGRGLPMVVANPDLYVTLPDGSMGRMPGLLAERYEALGGLVVSFGKPHAPAFEAALNMLSPDVHPSRVLHVGDSLAHDVAGANAAGIASLFVVGGIHADELASGQSEARVGSGSRTGAEGWLGEAALLRAFDAHGVRPSHSIAKFVW